MEQEPIPNPQPVSSHYRKDRGSFRFFIGLAIIFFGVLYLLQNTGFLNGVNVEMVLRTIWPVLIIFFGLSVLSRSGKIAYVLSSIIAVAILILIIFLLVHPAASSHGSKTFSQPSYLFNNQQPYGNYK